MESKLPEHIRKEIVDATDDLEKLVEYMLYAKDHGKALEQFRQLCVKTVSLYSLEAGTYIMKYVFTVNHFHDFICKNFNKIVALKEWSLFCDKAGSFVCEGVPPGFNEIVEIFNKRDTGRRHFDSVKNA